MGPSWRRLLLLWKAAGGKPCPTPKLSTISNESAGRLKSCWFYDYLNVNFRNCVQKLLGNSVSSPWHYRWLVSATQNGRPFMYEFLQVRYLKLILSVHKLRALGEGIKNMQAIPCTKQPRHGYSIIYLLCWLKVVFQLHVNQDLAIYIQKGMGVGGFCFVLKRSCSSSHVELLLLSVNLLFFLKKFSRVKRGSAQLGAPAPHPTLILVGWKYLQVRLHTIDVSWSFYPLQLCRFEPNRKKCATSVKSPSVTFDIIMVSKPLTKPNWWSPPCHVL